MGGNSPCCYIPPHTPVNPYRALCVYVYGVLAEWGAKSRNKQGKSREPGRVESGIKEARVGKQEGRELGNIDQSRETFPANQK